MHKSILHYKQVGKDRYVILNKLKLNPKNHIVDSEVPINNNIELCLNDLSYFIIVVVIRT